MKYRVNGQEWEPDTGNGAEVERLPDRLLVKTKQGSATAIVLKKGDTTYVSYRGRSYRIERGARKRATSDAESGGEVRAPMPGQIVDVACETGADVKAGDRLMVLEAMKMQQPVVARLDGKVKAVNVAVGDQVSEGQLLAVVEAQ